MKSILQDGPFGVSFGAWVQSRRTQRRRLTLLTAVVLVLVVLSAIRCDVQPKMIAASLRKGLPLIELFFQLAWRDVSTMLRPLAITAAMALFAAIVGMCLGLPCAIAAASNLSPRPLRQVMRSLIALERGIPEIVKMLLLVAVFGLGVVPGMVALSVSSIGMLAKLLADAIEEIEPTVLEVVEAVGATRSQVIRYAVIPQILPALLANGLFRFESNVRAGVILGAVGAGGIGYVMSSSMSAMEYGRASMATVLTLALVVASESVSNLLRTHILKGGQSR